MKNVLVFIIFEAHYLIFYIVCVLQLSVLSIKQARPVRAVSVSVRPLGTYDWKHLKTLLKVKKPYYLCY